MTTEQAARIIDAMPDTYTLTQALTCLQEASTKANPLEWDYVNRCPVCDEPTHHGYGLCARAMVDLECSPEEPTWQPVTWENSGRVFLLVMEGTHEYSDDGLQYRKRS